MKILERGKLDIPKAQNMTTHYHGLAQALKKMW